MEDKNWAQRRDVSYQTAECCWGLLDTRPRRVSDIAELPRKREVIQLLACIIHKMVALKLVTFTV